MACLAAFLESWPYWQCHSVEKGPFDDINVVLVGVDEVLLDGLSFKALTAAKTMTEKNYSSSLVKKTIFI